MSMSQNQVFEFALSLPQSERADLAFQLLQSLEYPRDAISPEVFRDEIHKRVQGCRQGKIKGHSLDEARAIVEQRLSEGRTP
jgi:putative addiction module component (TIGR02574 family)